jgi:hypothetical protein
VTATIEATWLWEWSPYIVAAAVLVGALTDGLIIAISSLRGGA